MPNQPKSPISHLTVFAEDIGARPAGTPAHQRAEAYIRTQFQQAGLTIQDVCVDFPNWSLIDATLLLDDTPLPVDVNPFSPACDVHAPTVAISTLPELEAADLAGKIALLYGELSKAPIFPINFAAVQFERDQAINRILINKQPAAVLAINLHPWRRQHIFEDEDFPIPSATVDVETGRTLLANRGQNLHLQINSHTTPSTVKTLVGRTPQSHPYRVVLCAHYDTKIGTPGAQDNGSGIATLLSLAETLPHQNLNIDLEFIAWADEEYGAHTDQAYITQMGDSLDTILCAINVDGIGLLTENTTLTALASSDALEKTVRNVQDKYPGVVWVEPWIQSNHATFAMRGIPSLALSSLTWERTHQTADTLAWIDPRKLDEARQLTADILVAIQNQLPNWSRI